MLGRRAGWIAATIGQGVGALKATALPADLPQALGAALEQLGEREQRVSREAAVAEITRVLAARHTIDDLFAAFATGAAKLVRFDLLIVAQLDAERREFELVSVTPRTPATPRPRERWMPLEGTLLARASRRRADPDRRRRRAGAG